MLTYVRQLLVAVLGGTVAAAVLLFAGGIEQQPTMALAQTSVTFSGVDSTDESAAKVINYQGQVFDPNSGQPYRNRGLNFSFRIYSNIGGTDQLFRDDRHIITNADGFFSANIGAPDKFDDIVDDIFNGQERYLGVYINEEQLGPIQPFTFVPYAFWTVRADHLDRYDSEDFPKIIAYGVVNSDGGRASGERFNSYRAEVAGETVYIIDIEGISHSISDYTTIVTPACNAPVMTGVGTSGDDLIVDMWNPSGARTTCRFVFMVLEK